MEDSPVSFRRRTRMISFRVTEHEFEQLKTKLEAEGARSISDFVRLTLCGSSNDSSERDGPGIDQLSGEIHQLSADVRRVAELLEDTKDSKDSRDSKDARDFKEPRRVPGERSSISTHPRKNGGAAHNG